jgi:hypothetical protein
MQVHAFFECERQTELAAACAAVGATLTVDKTPMPAHGKEAELLVRRTNLKMFIHSPADRVQAEAVRMELERRGLAVFVTDAIPWPPAKVKIQEWMRVVEPSCKVHLHYKEEDRMVQSTRVTRDRMILRLSI